LWKLYDFLGLPQIYVWGGGKVVSLRRKEEATGLKSVALFLAMVWLNNIPGKENFFQDRFTVFPQLLS